MPCEDCTNHCFKNEWTFTEIGLPLTCNTGMNLILQSFYFRHAKVVEDFCRKTVYLRNIWGLKAVIFSMKGVP